MIEGPLPISGAATALENQGLRKGQILTAVGEDLNKVFIKKGLTTPSLQISNLDTYRCRKIPARKLAKVLDFTRQLLTFHSSLTSGCVGYLKRKN